ncbi:putative transcriptional regulatory protein C1F7.11c [Grifola frondosa]|uniref:Putative transcriptional regulatory protein C1F7.11c n=1 Tax=Grifola frondosa TaxID=5627 RepID=A0A1C7MAX5_GRIFR|nr:putative transcriptional regulatory protein C1F7.11c [Grifola frondosa]
MKILSRCVHPFDNCLSFEMPVEPRRSSRKVSNDEDIEIKRARGEISCAECRRLKLKCDKKLPCGSCVRRGCTTICPNVDIRWREGRFILADTDQLHRKISEMSERIRQLEDALAIFQAGVSHERHPLLRDELLSIKFGPEVRRTVDEEHTRDALSKSIDALGTLTVGDHGETKYFGRSAGSETSSHEEEGDAVPPLEPEIANLAITFPLTIAEDGFDAVLDQLESHLPSQPRAWSLCEAYIEHFTWWCRPIKRDELVDDILTPIYNALKDPTKPGYRRNNLDGNRCPHLLAVLYLVLALGALVDLTLPSCSAEAETYYRLGRAALSLRSIFDSPEIETVQGVILIAAYHSLCSQRHSLESAWSLMSLAAKLAQSSKINSEYVNIIHVYLSVDRDSTQWNLDDKLVQRRRNLFWEIFTIEMIHCMCLGRPPALSLAHIDCELPVDEEESTDDDGNSLRGYWSFKHSFARDVYFIVIDGMLSAKAPSYASVLEFDRKIRQTTLPNVRLYLRPDEDDYNNPAVVLKSFFLSHYPMTHIHRTFFAQALLDHPTNPLSSPYAPSFLAANRCASVLLKSFIHHYQRFYTPLRFAAETDSSSCAYRCPQLCSRFWGMWTHAFSAAIILGSTVTRSPNATMAPSALTDLDLAVDFFEQGAAMSPRARQALPILRNLKERAVRAYSGFRNRHTSPSVDIHLRMAPEDEFHDELAIFGGQTRVMSSKSLTKKRKKHRIENSTSPRASPSMQSVSTPSDDGSSSTSLGGMPEQMPAGIHPSLMEYLSIFPASASVSVVTHHSPH